MNNAYEEFGPGHDHTSLSRLATIRQPPPRPGRHPTGSRL